MKKEITKIQSPSIKDALKETTVFKQSYSDKLKNPLWQRKRLEILNLRGFKCELCGCETKELHVHHRFYLKGREVWEYDNDVFQVLCCDCHEKEHSKKIKQVKVVDEKYEQILNLLDNDLDNLNHLISIIYDLRRFDISIILNNLRIIFTSDSEPNHLFSFINLLTGIVEDKNSYYEELNK